MKKNIIHILLLLLSSSYSYSMLHLFNPQHRAALGPWFMQVQLEKRIDTLIDEQVDPKDPRWNAYLLEATAQSETKNLVQKLLKNGANPNTQEPNTLNTPLHQSVMQGSLENIILLIEHNADQNLLNINGETPLMLAVASNKDPKLGKMIVLKLLQNGAKNEFVNNKGQKASDIARLNNFGKLAGLIESYPNPISLKNQCISFIKANKGKYKQNGFETLPTELQELFKICCNECNAKAYSLLICTQCRKAHYCNPECQKKAWPKHKLTCKKPVKPKQI